MKAILAVICLLVVAVAAEQTWKAGINENFVGKSTKDIKKLLGWKKNPNGIKLPTIVHPEMAVPTSFDARQAWPNCTSIGAIQNQAECGSCWAFGAVEAITDRFCIHKNNDTQLSFEDMVSCDKEDGGCQGGEPNSAWDYVKTEGLVSAECYPYSIPTCPPAQQPCLNFVNTPKCVKKCNVSSIEWKQDKHKISTAYSVSSDQSNIEKEILLNGPVEACFEVYEDFLTYKSGVYSHTTGDLLGGHCIKILGWGVDGSTPYWLAANSWTDYWGNQGFFWILRGSDECGIEDQVVAGLP
jgi:cathepsin B